MKTLFNIAILPLCLFSQIGHAAHPYESYIRQFKEVLANCSAEYSMQYTYPDSAVVNVKGTYAVKGDNYFDSSNTRYVLMNDRWYLHADHANKYLGVIYLKGLEKEMGGFGTLNISGYLYNNDFFEQIGGIEVVAQNEDTAWLKVNTANNPMLHELHVTVLRKTFRPVQYSVKLSYPLEEQSNIDITMTCNRIMYPADGAFFDHAKVIDEKQNKATLKRFRNYKSLMSNPQTK